MKVKSIARNALISVVLGGLTGFVYAAPVYDADNDTCNVKGLSKMKSAEQVGHVFNARLGNKGKGNGGESVDATVWTDSPTGDPVDPFVIGLNCVSTADEDTGGTVNVGLSDGTILIPDVGSTGEVDPGK
jgi:hypothetical protein